MHAEEKTAPDAWQPFTFAGVAAFATARTSRLLLVQGIVSLACAACMAVFFHAAWSNSISAAIEQLPDEGGIRNRELTWGGRGPQRLGAGTFLSFVIDPDGSGELGEAADVEFNLTRHELRIRSLFGYAALKYPGGVVIPLTRAELQPWWGARRPIILGLVALGSVFWLLTMWCLLALIYSIPLRLIAFYRDRKLLFSEAWRLGGAAVLPAALFMSMALMGYLIHRLNFLQLLAAGVAHVLIGWLLAFVAISHLKPLSVAPASPGHLSNPFADASSAQTTEPPDESGTGNKD
ncbi:MAG: hypothetical protein EXS31_01550 [Pedosphaera sp.]|nr:hypothetical protein [Pedosphaera sp.]